MWRDKRGDLQPEVTGSRSQSHRSSEGLQEQARPIRSGNAAQTKVWITGGSPPRAQPVQRADRQVRSRKTAPVKGGRKVETQSTESMKA